MKSIKEIRIRIVHFIFPWTKENKIHAKLINELIHLNDDLTINNVHDKIKRMDELNRQFKKYHADVEYKMSSNKTNLCCWWLWWFNLGHNGRVLYTKGFTWPHCILFVLLFYV